MIDGLERRVTLKLFPSSPKTPGEVIEIPVEFGVTLAIHAKNSTRRGKVMFTPQGDVVFSHDIAKLIDWLDDSDEYTVEIPPRYHFIYGFGLSIAAGIIVGIIGSALVPFSPALYALVNPKIVFFVYGFASSAAGYAIAWRKIPNKKGRK